MSEAKLNQANAEAMSKRDILRFYIMVLLFAFCTLIYYFGELIDFAGWDALRISFFFGVHDVHRLIYLAPIMYAGHFFGVRATIIVTILTIGAFLPRAIFISPYPDPLLRSMLFTVVAGVVGYLYSKARTDYKRASHLKTDLIEKR